ncbi:MAG: exonuclease domain-containing protein [Clostridiales bacterium]|nr:exonuclease domain-containing protein [Clostridiales bacterium]
MINRMVATKANEYVIVDVETTGLDANMDELIEIAAVKVRRGLVVEEFSTLVKPQRPIPSFISGLTGIHDEMLAQSPSPYEAVNSLAVFIGNAEIAAHNASFDSAFIARYWFNKRLWLDTITLLQVAYPCAPSYSLANLCAYLQIENVHAHRALDDARATAALFLCACKQLSKLPDQAKKDLLLLAENIDAPLENIIRRHCSILSGAKQWVADKSEETPLSNIIIDRDYCISLKEIQSFFGQNGLCKQRLKGFEYREAQLKMAEQIAISLNEGKFLLAEAGTGTGKSLAYLLPAALYVLNSRQKIAVSTHTKNLQEQLLHKDIPLLEQLLQQPIQAVVLKGRANYLCRRLYKGQLRHTEDNMRVFLMRVAAWLPDSPAGDGSELNLNSYDKGRWQRICASRENCDASCKNFKGNCFVNKVRREAEKADIFILNHALLLAGAAIDNTFLPSLSKLIIDEAHHLEKTAEDRFTTQADHYGIQQLLSRLRRGRGGGLLESLLRQAEALPDLDMQKRNLRNKLESLYEAIEQTGRESEQFFILLQQVFLAEAALDSYMPARLRLLPRHRSYLAWPDLSGLGQSLGALLSALSRDCLKYAEALLEFAHNSDYEFNGREELLSIALNCQDIATTIGRYMSEPTDTGYDNMVRWLEFAAKDKLPGLNMAPVEVGELLKATLYDHTESLVFTSATMTTGGNSFNYFKQRLGLDLLNEPPLEMLLPSPFFYREQALFTVCTSLPLWNKVPEVVAVEALAGVLLPLLTASRGRALVLFTSHAQLKAVYVLLRDPLAEQGITLLAHGISGEPSLLLARLMREDRCAILGAASFWEGIDVLGSALSMVVIVRLPFLPPNTPTVAARVERIEAKGGNSFYEYSLPQAMLRFKQGFGRLIRSVEDSGVFCVLDKRIVEKSYGRMFQKSLPEMKRLTGDAGELAKQIADWLD